MIHRASDFGSCEMTDFYPVLANTILRLANNNAKEREALYEHARNNIVAQLQRRDAKISAVEIKRQCDALEAAIRRVEAESLSQDSHTLHRPPLTAGVEGEGNNVGFRRGSSKQDEAKTNPAPAPTDKPNQNRVEAKPAAALPDHSGPSDDMDRIPQALAAMLFGIAFLAGTIAFIGFIYIRGLGLVYKGIISYSLLLVAIAMMLCLSIVLSMAIFRKPRISERT
jgi:hypothetical protein